ARHTALRTLAEGTDGMAIVDTSAIDQGLKRIVDDLSSYYLLGYYSTGKLDGRFHAITVRVTRSGVQIRARRGYVAATTASAALPSPSAAASAAATPEVEAALGALEVGGREAPLRLHAAAGWTPAGSATWVVIERGRGAGSSDWTAGGQADVLI